MSPFVKTCIADIVILAALAAPTLVAGCERPSEPPVDPRAAADVRAHAATARVAFGIDDATLVARVKDALRADDDVKGLAIAVAVREGRVTLQGELAHQAQVARAVDVARRVEGVETVINLLSTPSSRRSL